jgi:thiamine transporter ThiT
MRKRFIRLTIFILLIFLITSTITTQGATPSAFANGNFENWISDTDMENWVESPATSTIEKDTSRVHGGSFSVKIEHAADDSTNHPQIFQVVRLSTATTGQVYNFTLWIFDNDPNSWARLELIFEENKYYSENSTDSDEWQQLYVNSTIGYKECTITITVYGGSGNIGIVFLDDAAFKPTGIPVLAAITPDMVLLLGIVLTGSITIVCLYIGYKKKAYEPLKSVRVLTQIAVYSALGLVLSFFAIPFILDTHISSHLFPAFLLTMSYGPFVGLISGAIVGSKGMLTGNWTGPVSNAFFCIIIGTLSMSINPEKRGRPMYMILINIIVGTWTFGLLHMWYTFVGIVVPFLVILNLLLSLPNNILYGILVEAIINVEQIWDPLTEESTLKWYHDDYESPSEEIQRKHTILQVLALNALIYGWFAFIWLSPPFDYLLQLNIYNPMLFVVMLLISLILVLTSYFIYRSQYLSLVSPLTLIGSILTLPIGLLGLYVWFKYLKKGDIAVISVEKSD